MGGKAYGPGMIETTEAEHELAVRGFVALWQGHRPRLADLDAEPATVEALQRRGLIVVDAEGRIAGIHGLSTTPTAHQVTWAAGSINTWCAFDAIGVPAALVLDARITTTCPTCAAGLDVIFTRGQPEADAAQRLWLPTADCAHVLDDLCAHANLYCNERHLTSHIRSTAGAILTVHDAAELGRRTWADAAAALT